MIWQKTPTLVEPIPHKNIRKHHTLDKGGVTVNERAISRLREALASGIYQHDLIRPQKSSEEILAKLINDSFVAWNCTKSCSRLCFKCCYIFVDSL